jgi:hypothetical protein
MKRASVGLALFLVIGACGRDSHAGTQATISRSAVSGSETATTVAPTTALTQSSIKPTSGGETSTTTDRLELPHWNEGDALGAVGVKATGIVGDSAAGCVWIEYGDALHAAFWPPGTTAKFNPLRLLDSANNIIWTEGEAHNFGGSPRAEGDTTGIPPQCRNGNDVAVVSGVYAPAS